jgi:hypothetical protein
MVTKLCWLLFSMLGFSAFLSARPVPAANPSQAPRSAENPAPEKAPESPARRPFVATLLRALSAFES